MNKLKEYRTKAGLSKLALSKKSGVSRPTIDALESGFDTETKTSTLAKLADALGEPISAIFFE